ncbi:farnesol dehydrogenase-like [Pseudomyrmex gracilis]|uniref:farnesol dehydrogenase-like n=1 Tax=Pseudomyrmex gracilis TaxID=219809 RepID=UPI0009949F19|nr:farnesol dehydrogenase-like [Pseudomyrmex gracilis]XP_020278901.1 farnesol dehydrogenase-like [Pseudomyrmex gracilis]XP_020278902.1 farnesol dehydrogenase-like [Pseudomyrmex gracilis]XP_020278903.1 farnesol dehydrogenase-like [Pseudomyrmex gracilis]XP_020278904.1 farnesol dehydrogenase-like [Pseudomyrmex gracilis]XP_020278905.1 farnesol dehydrogenase-like [Pseudomyrmex gracilis]XP_020278906.1 farnesol dehydrogenase-like [Pseudomyrmex gracilis]
MDRWLGKTAVVTGAAAGIGKAITRALLRNGVNVVALDVQKEGLAKLDAESKSEGFPSTLHTICCDITREDDINAAFATIEALGGVDIMVNNAGVTSSTRIIESDRKTFERLLNINVLAVAVFTNKAVRSMRHRNVEGHIFNVNSILGHQSLDSSFFSNGLHFNLYSASKHASVALTDTVRREISVLNLPIRITSVCPGVVKPTGMMYDSLVGSKFLENCPAIQPEDIADAVIYALGRRPQVQITEIKLQHTGEFV